MIRNAGIFLLIFLLPAAVCAQIDSVAVRLEKISVCKDDSLRIAYADEIVKLLETSGYGFYNGEKPVKYLSYKRCANANAELFAWSFPLKDDDFAYYNIFRFKGGQVYGLKYFSNAENSLPPYLFYDFMAFNADGKQYFMLLGWTQTGQSNRKAIQVAQFGEGGTVRFDAPLMRRGNSSTALLAFEYSKEASMMLKFDKKGRRIIFDHLSPSEERYRKYPMFYGPDATYDALELRKGWWEYMENVKW